MLILYREADHPEGREGVNQDRHCREREEGREGIERGGGLNGYKNK